MAFMTIGLLTCYNDKNKMKQKCEFGAKPAKLIVIRIVLSANRKSVKSESLVIVEQHCHGE